MQTKLTLSVDKDFVGHAKELARKKGVSLSKLFQKLLMEKLIEESGAEKDSGLPPLSEKLKRLYGSMELPDGLSVEEARNQYLLKKHG